jgi:hypothetical protein
VDPLIAEPSRFAELLLDGDTGSDEEIIGDGIGVGVTEGVIVGVFVGVFEGVLVGVSVGEVVGVDVAVGSSINAPGLGTKIGIEDPLLVADATSPANKTVISFGSCP